MIELKLITNSLASQNNSKSYENKLLVVDIYGRLHL